MQRFARRRVLLSESETYIHLFFIDEALAIPIDDHTVRQEIVCCRQPLQLAFIGDRRGAHDKRLVHLVEPRTNRFGHTLTVTGIGRRARRPFDRPWEMFRHHFWVPFKSAAC